MKDQLIALLQTLYPVKTKYELIRVGGNNDGGYLIPNDLHSIATCFSPGVDVTANFEKIKLSVDLGYSRSNGPSLNVGYAIPIGSSNSRESKHDHKLHFPLETIYAEVDRNHFRELLSKITFTMSTGTGRFYFKHKLEGVGVYQSDTLGPLLIRSATPRPTSGASSWITGTGSKAIPSQVAPGEVLTPTDTSFVMTSRTLGVPLNLQASVRIKAFTAGIGVGLELIGNNRFTPVNAFSNANDFPFTNNVIRSVPLSKGNVSISKFYGYGGYDFYMLDRYVFRGDVMIGQMSVGRNFNQAAIRPGLIFNAGLNIRRDLSEFLSVFIRPSVEHKSYILNSPETGTAIKHRINSVYLNFGLNVNIPTLPKCYITACRTQIDHPHGNRHYRSRVHPIYQKQNPGYGENKVRVKPNRVRTRKDGAVPR